MCADYAGYVLFEMACGYELTPLVPGDTEYHSVREQEVKEVVQFIFSRTSEGQFSHNIHQVYDGIIEGATGI